MENHRQSAYLGEKMEQLSESEDAERRLRGLMQLRDLMVHTKMGYGSEALGYLRVSLRDKYPVTYEALEEELG